MKYSEVKNSKSLQLCIIHSWAHKSFHPQKDYNIVVSNFILKFSKPGKYKISKVL